MLRDKRDQNLCDNVDLKNWVVTVRESHIEFKFLQQLKIKCI